jgi:hypothetical protein
LSTNGSTAGSDGTTSCAEGVRYSTGGACASAPPARDQPGTSGSAADAGRLCGVARAEPGARLPLGSCLGLHRRGTGGARAHHQLPVDRVKVARGGHASCVGAHQRHRRVASQADRRLAHGTRHPARAQEGGNSNFPAGKAPGGAAKVLAQWHVHGGRQLLARRSRLALGWSWLCSALLHERFQPLLTARPAASGSVLFPTWVLRHVVHHVFPFSNIDALSQLLRFRHATQRTAALCSQCCVRAHWRPPRGCRHGR